MTLTAPPPSTLAGYRGDAVPRLTGAPHCPSSGRLFRGGRLRKYWRYVGVWGPEVSVCAAEVKVGALRHEFWAVWDTTTGRLHEHTSMTSGRVSITPERLTVRDRDVTIDLALDNHDDHAFEVLTPDRRAWTWTRKVASHADGFIRIGAST